MTTDIRKIIDKRAGIPALFSFLTKSLQFVHNSTARCGSERAVFSIYEQIVNFL